VWNVQTHVTSTWEQAQRTPGVAVDRRLGIGDWALPPLETAMKRRHYLTGIAGLGTLGTLSQLADATETDEFGAVDAAATTDSWDAGLPRFMQVDEKAVGTPNAPDNPVGDRLLDHPYLDFTEKDRDNIAPWIKGAPDRAPSNYAAGEFGWSITEQPTGSDPWFEASLYKELLVDVYGEDPASVDDEYLSGRENTMEFKPDQPGTYVLELNAPDGTYEKTIHVWPGPPDDAGGPPIFELDGHFDSAAGEFVIEPSVEINPTSNQSMEDVEVAYLPRDSDALDRSEITMDGLTARIPKSAVGDMSYLYGAAFDGQVHSTTDEVLLDATSETVKLPNRPPEWIQNGVMYEIFTRSFQGTRGGTTFASIEDRVRYLDDLGIDVVWFTPIVPAESSNWKPNNGFQYVGGGPHGYDTLSYYHVAPDLGSDGTTATALEEFKQFKQACNDRGIKVCVDFVINHAGRHHQLFQDTIASTDGTVPEGWTYEGVDAWNTGSSYFDWFDRIQTDITDGSGNQVEPSPSPTYFAGLRVMPNWNYGTVAVREHILAAAAFWAGQVGVDAFRCDIAYGVPHSFWKELRKLVRSYDSEFMLLDETIPNDISFSESEFDLHFDTNEFMNTAKYVVEALGEEESADVDLLKVPITERTKEGWPDHALTLNSIENHDEHRTLNGAAVDLSNPDHGSVSDATWEKYAKRQRAAWAAGVVLPGVPFIYYGQERQISRYGEGRHQGSSDPRGTNDDGSINTGSDVRPGGRQRAFMNWASQGDTVPSGHLQFYKDVVALYQDLEILKPEYGMAEPSYTTDDNVLVAGRTGGDGMDDAIVMVNFDQSPGTVDLRPAVDPTDQFTGADITKNTDGGSLTVEVEDLAVLRVDEISALGTKVTELADAAGDDVGPGTYTYPTSGDFGTADFDISGVTVRDAGGAWQFEVGIGGEVTNPFGLPEGFSHQFLQFYLHDPDAGGGSTVGRAGTNVTFEDPHQYRVLANGQNGTWVEDSAGNTLAEGRVSANKAEDTILVEFPKDALSADLTSLYVAPLVFGYDGFGTGGIRAVEETNSGYTFGGAQNSNAPAVIDMVTPPGISQSQALRYSSSSRATVPYSAVQRADYEREAVFEDDTGDNDGPGSYTLPTNSAFYSGVWDVQNLAVSKSTSRVRFEFEMASEVQNPFGLPRGFSHEFFQVYVRDPDAAATGTTDGRDGTGVTFEEDYHYRILVNGQYEKHVEDATGSTVTEDVNVSVDGKTISFDLPLGAVGGSLSDLEIAPLVFGFDGFGTGHVRDVAASGGEYVIGGGTDDGSDPKVLDMVTPEGVSQSDALSYSAGSPATVPFVPFAEGTNRGVVQQWGNEVLGDDHGPGEYTYPTNDPFKDGVFDMNTVKVTDRVSEYEFTVKLDGPVTNPWNYQAGFCLQAFHLYVHDPAAGSDQPASHVGRTGSNVLTEAPYHYRVYVDGNTQVAEQADGSQIASGLGASADPDSGTISFRVPKSAIGGDLSNKKLALMLFGHDGFGPGGIRPVTETAQTWRFGGARTENAPNVIDLLSPYGVIDQSDALSYGATSKAKVPLLDVSAKGREPPENERGAGRGEDPPGETKRGKGRGEDDSQGKRGQGRGNGDGSAGGGRDGSSDGARGSSRSDGSGDGDGRDSGSGDSRGDSQRGDGDARGRRQSGEGDTATGDQRRQSQ
jgi:carbohydrate-binding DOMON domain-containing protein